jgi:hypothetical protein
MQSVASQKILTSESAPPAGAGLVLWREEEQDFSGQNLGPQCSSALGRSGSEFQFDAITIYNDAKYGARHLKRAIEKNVVVPLANLVATAQVKLGDFIRIDRTPEGSMTFTSEVESAMASIQWERSYGLASMPPMAARAAGWRATP